MSTGPVLKPFQPDRDLVEVKRDPVGRAGGLHGIAQQTRNRHRTNAARHRGNRARNCFRGGIVHVSYQSGLAFLSFDPVDTDVDDRCAGLDLVSWDHFRTANRRHQDIGLTTDPGQIWGTRVGDGHRTAFCKQQGCHWHSDNI